MTIGHIHALMNELAGEKVLLLDVEGGWMRLWHIFSIVGLKERDALACLSVSSAGMAPQEETRHFHLFKMPVQHSADSMIFSGSKSATMFGPDEKHFAHLCNLVRMLQRKKIIYVKGRKI